MNILRLGLGLVSLGLGLILVLAVDLELGLGLPGMEQVKLHIGFLMCRHSQLRYKHRSGLSGRYYLLNVMVLIMDLSHLPYFYFYILLFMFVLNCDKTVIDVRNTVCLLVQLLVSVLENVFVE